MKTRVTRSMMHWDDRFIWPGNMYFEDREQILRARDAAVAMHERDRLRVSTGLDDEEVLEDLRLLGLSPRALVALYLLPAIDVAWAEGRLSRLERERILQLAAKRGLVEGSPAWPVFSKWLARRPDAATVRRGLKALAALVEALPPWERERIRVELVDECERVARASGGLLGLGARVCAEERERIAEIERCLN